MTRHHDYRRLIQLDPCGRRAAAVNKGIEVLAQYFIWQMNSSLFDVVPDKRRGIPDDGLYFQLRKLNAHRLQLTLDSIIRWQKFNDRLGYFVPCDVPMEVVRTIMSKRGGWPFPHLGDLIGWDNGKDWPR